VIKEVHLAGTAIHEQLDHPLGSGLMVGAMTRGHRINADRLCRQKLPERHTAESGPQMTHEIPPVERAT
jgi:hypothetical protein